MYNETIQPPEANAQYLGWGPSLLGAEFVRCRVCQGPSLSGAEMSQNHLAAYGLQVQSDLFGKLHDVHKLLLHCNGRV